MPAARPFDFAARSASIIFFKVAASVGSLMVSPLAYIEPSGFSQYFWLSGQLLKNSRLFLIEADVRGRIGKPFSAYSSARAETSSKLIVPQRSSTVSAACSVPGTTAGSRPSPFKFFLRASYQSIVAPLGAQPCPTTAVTFLVLSG